MTNNTSIVTLVEETRINEHWYASRQSNGSLVLHNFASDATEQDVQDLETVELHFDASEAEHIAQLIGIAI